MANKVISMQQIRTLIQLLEKEYSLRSITIQLKLSRQTVTLYANRLNNSDQSFEQLRQLSDADLAGIVYSPEVVTHLSLSDRHREIKERMTYFLSELKRTGVTRLLLWEEYRKESLDPYELLIFVFC